MLPGSGAQEAKRFILFEGFGKLLLPVDRRSLHNRRVVKRSEHQWGKIDWRHPRPITGAPHVYRNFTSEHSAAARLPMREALSVSFFLIAHWERFEIPCLFFPGSRRRGLACRAIEYGRAAGAS